MDPELRQLLESLRSANVTFRDDIVKKIDNLQQSMDSKIDNLDEKMNTEFGHLREGIVRKRMERERGAEYTHDFEAFSFIQLAEKVLDMPAFRGQYDSFDKHTVIGNSSHSLMLLVDDLLRATLTKDNRFPQALEGALDEKNFAAVYNLLDVMLKNEKGNFSKYELETLECMANYYSPPPQNAQPISNHNRRFKFLAQSGLGIQALRFHLAPNANKHLLQIGKTLEFDMQGEIRMFGKLVVVEAAEIKSQYSSEAVDQVLLRVRALDWCVRMMKLATEEDIMLIAKLYILRRTERNEDFASGQKTPDSKVGTVIVNTYYL